MIRCHYVGKTLEALSDKKSPKLSNINMFKWSKSALKTQVWILLHHNFERVFVCDRTLSLTEDRLKAQKD